jgi:hypothetical protein
MNSYFSSDDIQVSYSFRVASIPVKYIHIWLRTIIIFYLLKSHKKKRNHEENEAC